MGAIQQLIDSGQSLWLDRLTRDLLASGQLQRDIDELSVDGVITNPEALARAISGSPDYDRSIFSAATTWREPEDAFYELVKEDLLWAAGLLTPLYERSYRLDGWVTLPVSPRLREAHRQMHAQGLRLFREVRLPNIALQVPGTDEGVRAAEELVADGVPVMVSSVFSPRQYARAADACMRGMERRLAAGRDPFVRCFVSVGLRAWNMLAERAAPAGLRKQLALAVGARIYRCHCDDRDSARSDRLAEAGAIPPWVCWANSDGPIAHPADVLSMETLVAPETVVIASEPSLLTFARHGHVEDLLPRDGGDADAVLVEARRAGMDLEALAEALQREALLEARQQWLDLLTALEARADALHERHGDVLT
jgi:transaldolase